ncbi:MAG: hypothetical protein JWP78_2026 [Mucilaginibacter sp.]|nr:hypothetical protein [Mucilaginibacter sp.]
MLIINLKSNITSSVTSGMKQLPIITIIVFLLFLDGFLSKFQRFHLNKKLQQIYR